MNKDEFVDMVLKGSRDNQELQNKVETQKYVYFKKGLKIKKATLISIQMFPYGEFEVGNWNGKTHKDRTTLYWKDYGKTWALTKEELL